MTSMLASKPHYPIFINVQDKDSDKWSGDIIIMNEMELLYFEKSLRESSPGFKFRFVSKT
jgi:hypothetical protein